MVRGEVFFESTHHASLGVMDALSQPENENVVHDIFADIVGAHHHGVTRSLDERDWAILQGAFEHARYVIVPLHSDPKRFGWEAVSIDDRRIYVMRLLVSSYQYTDIAAAGIVGNLEAESDILPDRIEGSADTSPLRARGFTGTRTRQFSPADVMNRNASARTGPALPGVGLAQWTWPPRRHGLFHRKAGGVDLGDAILQDMDAQVQYLVSELRAWGNKLQPRLMAAKTAYEACDLVAYEYEGPGAMESPPGNKLPMADSRVQAVLNQRRPLAQKALEAYRAAGASP